MPVPVPEGRIKYGWVVGTRIWWVAYELHLGVICPRLSKDSPGVARVVLVGEYPEVHSQTGTAAGRVASSSGPVNHSAIEAVGRTAGLR